MPSSMPEAEQEQLRADARKAIGEQLIPACGKLLTFFREEYVPNARDTLAAEAMPGGEAWYRQQIREYTTLDLDPDEIHAIGLREVDGIQREMDAIIREVGFRSEEHTSELQSLMRISYAVFCLKKKKHTKNLHKTKLIASQHTH